LDNVYATCLESMNPSFVKVSRLVGEGKLEDAREEFRTGFVTPVKKLYTEAADTPPKRYLKDCNWNSKVKSLYKLSMRTQGILNEGDKSEARERLDSLREFFYRLHKDNDLMHSGDAILELKRELDAIAKRGAATEEEVASIGALLKTIATTRPPMRMSKDAAAYSEECAPLLADIREDVTAARIDQAAIGRMKAAANRLHARYGMDIE